MSREHATVTLSRGELTDYLAASPLVQKVHAIHMLARAGTLEEATLLYPPGKSTFDPIRIPTFNGVSVKRIILEDSEFIDMWEDQEHSYDPKHRKAQASLTGREALADFLIDPEVSDTAKVFVLTPNFRDHIGKLGFEPGPYFQRTLDELRSGNLETIQLITEHGSVFRRMDNYHFNATNWIFPDFSFEGALEGAYREPSQYIEKVAEDIEYFARKKENIGELLNIAFDHTDKAPWREFVLKHFDTAYYLYVASAFYGSFEVLDRAKKLFDALPKSEWDFLARIFDLRGVDEDYDGEILAGNLDRPKVAAKFYEIVDSTGMTSYSFQGDEEIIQTWTDKFKAGEISAEKYLQFARNFRLKTDALWGWDGHMTARYPHSLEPHLKEDGVPLMLTDVFIEEGELIARLYDAGLNPTRKNRDKARGKDADLAFVRELTHSLDEQLGQYKYIDIIPVIDYWANRFFAGTATHNDLLTVSRNCAALNKAEADFLLTFSDGKVGNNLIVNDDIRSKVQKELKEFHLAEDLLRDSATVADLLARGVMPTSPLLSFLFNKGEAGMAEIDELLLATSEGRFDPSNHIQRELEFANYMRATKTNNHSEFHKVPVFVNQEEISPLKASERMEAEAASLEAANFYWFIKSRVDQGRDTVVIGNERFGNRFCVDPLRRDLEDLGVSVNSYGAYVHSMIENDAHDFGTILPSSFVDYLVSKGYPDVVVVDGSDDVIRGETPRLPSAHIGYLGWFIALNEALGVTDYLTPSIEKVLKRNESYGKLVDSLRGRIITPYHISFWTPQSHSQVIIGSHVTDHRDPTTEGPQLILASPVMIPSMHPDFPAELSEHEPGYFNDPDEKVDRRQELVFTDKGLGHHYEGMSEETYTNLVQNAMIAALPRMIRMTNPRFR